VNLTDNSHLDAFWLQTLDEYFYGNGTFRDRKKVNVSKLFSEMIISLNNSTSQTYAIAEIGFFERW
jgi:hypothetical protein